MLVTQGYLVTISVIMAWQLSQFEEVRAVPTGVDRDASC
jgi:hypothetical protein